MIFYTNTTWKRHSDILSLQDYSLDFVCGRSYLLLLAVLLYMTSCHDEDRQKADTNTFEWMIIDFVKVDSLNPILTPHADQKFNCPITGRIVNWESRNVLNPSAIVHNGKVHLFYRAQDETGTSRIGMAVSDDGLHFDKMPEPVFFPDEDDMKTSEWNYRKFDPTILDTLCTSCYFDGVEDPRIVQAPDGSYIMTYTSYDGKTARLSIATSHNLSQWTKHGSVFSEEEYQDLWSKSGAIVVERKEENFVAKMINGYYWMYFGDTDLFLARSTDLINWQVCKNDENQQMIAVLQPRKGYFDSRLVEPGPMALYSDNGILLIYNSSNAANFNDPDLPQFTYAAGQALYDAQHPYKLIGRSDSYFIHPDKDYERVGEVNEVCFVEGLVYFHDSWFLYYGTGDSKIAVAVSIDQKKF